MKTTLLSLTALLLIASLSFAGGGQGPGDGRDGPRTGQRGRVLDRLDRRSDRRQRVRQFVRSLQFTETQKAQALQAARAVQPLAESARAEAQRIIADARRANPTGDRAAIRAAVKAELKAVRERAAAQIVPNGRALLHSLTPEQRAKIEAALARHSKTFDEDRAARRLAFLISRPRAVQFLEARTQR